ncbi:MAG: HupE/UreJ family protein [Polyangiaceae bacterium]|nr:HupE/UreJ family protein [Polyangiaceae bacterium]MBK8939315.1 HupE/UreJ family protein [Polyangiaceae bacterium]
MTPLRPPRLASTRAALVFSLALLALLLCPRVASAHEIDLSRGDYRSSPDGAEAWIEMSRPDLVRLLPSLDRDGDGALSNDEIVASDAANARLLSLISAKRGGVDCAGAVVQLAPSDDKGGLFGVRFGPCEGDAPLVAIQVGRLFAATSFSHRQTAFVHVEGEEKPREALIHGQDARVEVPVAGATAPAAPAARGAWPIAKESLVFGVEHILFGYDHVLFLLGLVLLGGRMRDFATTITAFTLSHSITLGIMVMGVVAPPATIIEPVIALSIAYVGVENFFVKDLQRRWRVAFVFGFIHGFGFASAVGDKLSSERLPLALATFNLGVELGQLALLAVIVPLLVLLRKQAWAQPRGVQIISGAIVVMGLYWFVERVFLA